MRSRLLLLGGQTVALGLTTAFLVVPVSALFLDRYGADALPYAYLTVAVAGVGVSSAMSRAQRRFSLGRLSAAVIGAYLCTVAAGWVLLTLSGAPWVTFPLLVLFPLWIPVGFVLVGSQAGRLLDVREMKAHFPRVAAGFSVGFAVGGLAAAGLVTPLGGPGHLLGFDVLAAAILLVLVLTTARAFPAELGTPPGRTQVPAEPGRAVIGQRRSPFGNRLVGLVLAYQVLSAAVTQLLDFMVWERAAARYPDPSSLAEFQGVFGAVINVISVVFVVVAAGWLLTRFGVGFGLAANPVGVLLLLVATTVVGYSAGPVGFMFFALVCAQQVTDIALTDGTTRTAINASYQALRPEERLRAQTMVEGAGVPLALGVVGALLIGFDALGLGIRAVVVTTLLLTALWSVSALLAFREYGASLRHVLSARAWDPLALRIDDAASHAAVGQLLASRDPHDVQASLDALADSGHDVSEHLLVLMADDDPVRRLLGVQATVATGRLAEPEVAASAAALVHDPDPDVAVHAAAAAVRLEKGRREAGRSRWLGALADDDPATARRALAAATALPDRFFVPYLVGLASSTSASADVLDALAAHCDHLAPRVSGLLADPAVPRLTRQRIVHFLGRSAGGDARDLLVAHLDDGDPVIVEAAAVCLVAVGHTETPERLDLATRLTVLGTRVGRCLDVLALLDDRPSREPLAAALRDQIVDARRRAEVLLELVHDARAVGSAALALSSPDDRVRSTALELLEVTVGRSTARTTLALLDPGLDDAARRRMLGHRPSGPTSLADWLPRLVDDENGWADPWLRACALFAVATELPPEVAAALAARHVHDPDRDVAEIARWVTDREKPARLGAAPVGQTAR